jgi:predicted ATPase
VTGHARLAGEGMSFPSPGRAAAVSRGRATRLRGRSGEVSVLAGLVEAVRAGQSRVLVVRGEPGVGKTALLDDLAGRAAGCRVVRTAGMQSEIELAFAGLHQLLAPMLDQLEQLPGPQREALRTVFGISAGPAPDRFLVALAVLGLLAEAAGERPLVCVIDDQQWLDRASAQALGFAARRLAADPVGLVFAARKPGEELAGLPELDRLEIQALGVLVFADQRPGPGLDPERPVSGGGAGGRAKPPEGTGRTLEGSGPGRRLDQLGQRPGGQPQLVRIRTGLLGRGQRLVIAAQAVAEHCGGPGSGGQPQPVPQVPSPSR